MSAPGPSSIPTSADPRSRRPTKKRALSPTSAHAASLDALFAKPDQNIAIPPPSSSSQAKRPRHLPPEIVTNVQGSSAGAGSGEFHVYKASRRREYERLRRMDEDLKQEKEQEQFEKDKADKLRRDEERTRKNREKREKMKARKAKERGDANANLNANEHHQRALAVKNGHGEQSTSGADDGRASEDDAAEQVSLAAPAVGLVIHDDDA
ncbi:hypothetical protein C2857_000602 [Epichloe festucae Fl1]|uniref:DUF1168 domain protein n=1 Tax=Epichloe festucae (strain Fl1) TaxID=877507 RepID=A0A7S9KV96_EPIFF|nr:hypothetical protein C2857_000602 [Epichloe festucae Fl1]